MLAGRFFWLCYGCYGFWKSCKMLGIITWRGGMNFRAIVWLDTHHSNNCLHSWKQMKRQQKHIQPPEVRTRFYKIWMVHMLQTIILLERDGETFQCKITMSHCLSLPYKKPTKPQGRTRKVQKFSKTSYRSCRHSGCYFSCQLIMERRFIIILANIIAKRMRFKRLEKIKPMFTEQQLWRTKLFSIEGEKSEQLASIHMKHKTPISHLARVMSF